LYNLQGLVIGGGVVGGGGGGGVVLRGLGNLGTTNFWGIFRLEYLFLLDPF